MERKYHEASKTPSRRSWAIRSTERGRSRITEPHSVAGGLENERHQGASGSSRAEDAGMITLQDVMNLVKRRSWRSGQMNQYVM